MALKRIDFIDNLGEEREVYTVIEEETSHSKGVYNARLRKYIIKDGIKLDKSFDEFVVNNIKVDLSEPIRQQIYDCINDGSYENVFEPGQQ